MSLDKFGRESSWAMFCQAGPGWAKLGQAWPISAKLGQAGPSWVKIKMKHKLSGQENYKKGKIRKTRLNSNGRSMSKIGKIRG